MADNDATSRNTNSDPVAQVGQIVELVKDYARQETIGPLKGAGRWIGFGAAGALCLGVAAVYLVLGLLRMLQAEFAETFSGRWMSLLPYVFALVLAVLIIGIAASRIGKKSLQKENN